MRASISNVNFAPIFSSRAPNPRIGQHWAHAGFAVRFSGMPTGFGASHIDHVTIITHDLSRSRDFFSRVLQLVEIRRPESFDFPGTWFKIGPNVLHILEKPEPDTISARHFCIWVEDIRQAAEHAKSVGWEVSWQLNYKISGIDRFFLKDPDGNRIEIQGSDAAGLVA